MLFTYSEWDKFCSALAGNGVLSVTAESILKSSFQDDFKQVRFVNIKHDVEATPVKALDLSRIEAKYGHRSSYYVQAYLMTDANLEIFREIQRLGHEVTYHHDVMDCAKGDLQLALELYKENVSRFEGYGFPIVTVCQHGNPASQYANRDFFRSEDIQKLLPGQADIMVNFMSKSRCCYTYISDVGMEFKIVTDPVNSDKVKESEKYIVLGEPSQVVQTICSNPEISYIVSAHPHRYNRTRFKARLRKALFFSLKSIAKLLFKIPGVKRFVFRFSSITKYL